MSRLLFWRAPSVKLRCVWALQATTLSDSPLHPGLLAEPRLSQFLPGYLVTAQQKVSVPTEGREMGDYDEYSARGQLLRNGYDQRLDRGWSFESVLQGYLSKMVPKAAAPTAYAQTRAKTYFERTLQLFNLHDVEPVLVIMPYHPDGAGRLPRGGVGRQGGGVQGLPGEPAGPLPLPPAGLHRPRVVPRRRRRVLRRRARHGRQCAPHPGAGRQGRAGSLSLRRVAGAAVGRRG